MKDRIYICHTYYHAYISFLKELALPKEKRGGATLMLSTMSNRFESFGERAEKTGLFEEVLMFDEKREDFFPELASLRQDKGNLVANLLQRIRFTKRYAELEAPYVPVNLREYGDIYVFCDSDPIGYYLNRNRIPYHAVEDGLNTLVHSDDARYDNRGHFGLKAFLSERCNLIFVQNGYGKYCIDMEVNDIGAIAIPYRKYVECPRKNLTSRLTKEDVDLLMKAFVRDPEFLEEKIAECNSAGGKKILILTDPVCELDVREKIFRDIIAVYEKEGQIFLKPHPRDLLDYAGKFPNYPMFDATMPMEMLNFVPDLHFDKVVTIYTDLKGIEFADACVRLGDSFMDGYENADKHGFNVWAGIPAETDDKLGA